MWTALHNQILDLVRQYYEQRHRPAPFVPGKSPVPYGGRVFDEEELVAGVESLLDFWLTLGPEGDQLEAELSSYVGARHALLVNSGSAVRGVKLPPIITSSFASPANSGSTLMASAMLVMGPAP